MSSDSQSHPAHLAHHFDTSEQQFSAAKLGIWLFLCTEILMFGGLFVGYAIYNDRYPELFALGAKQLDWRLGALNTIVLLVSSFTMAIGIYWCQKNNNQKAKWYLWATVACGVIFMVIKSLEYSSKIHHGFLPGTLFNNPEFPAELGMYFGFYFIMTGVHASHVLVGMGCIVWVALRAGKNEFSSEYYTPVECTGLFWHLVDLIWIYLFPLLYLVG